MRLLVFMAMAIVLQACGTPTVMAEFSLQADVSPRDERFDWKFRAGMHSFGGAISNRSSETICMRFDEAVLKSNLHPAPVPLVISSWSDDLEGKPNTLKWRWIDPAERRYFPPLSLCLEPGKEVSVALMPDLRELFPTQKMFNSRWAESDTSPIDKGIGNWIGITLPIDIAGQRQMLEARLTALDSTGRMARVVKRH